MLNSFFIFFEKQMDFISLQETTLGLVVMRVHAEGKLPRRNCPAYTDNNTTIYIAVWCWIAILTHILI